MEVKEINSKGLRKFDIRLKLENKKNFCSNTINTAKYNA